MSALLDLARVVLESQTDVGRGSTIGPFSVAYLETVNENQQESFVHDCNQFSRIFIATAGEA